MCGQKLKETTSFLQYLNLWQWFEGFLQWLFRGCSGELEGYRANLPSERVLQCKVTHNQYLHTYMYKVMM